MQRKRTAAFLRNMASVIVASPWKTVNYIDVAHALTSEACGKTEA